MKKVFKSAAFLVASILTLNIHAQDIQEIFAKYNTAACIKYLDDHTLLVLGSNDVIYKITDDGTILDTQILFENDTINYLGYTRFYNGLNGKHVFFRIERSDTAQTYRLYEIDEHLNITDLDFTLPISENIVDIDKANHHIFNADGSWIYSYIIVGDTQDDYKTKVVKIDTDGNLVGEQIFTNCAQACWYNNLLPTADSLGCRVIVGRADESGWLVYDCYTLDVQMNIVDVKENIENLSYPYVPDGGYYRLNPKNGRIYSIGDFYQKIDGFYPNYTRNLIMSVYDPDLNQMKYRRCPWVTKTGNAGGSNFTIDFGPENEVYMLGGMDLFDAFTQNLYIACFDEDLNVIGELYYKDPKRFLQYLELAASPQGGCVVSCLDMYTRNGYVYKVTMSDFLNVEEAHANGFATAMAYPNPGNNRLNIRTALPNSRVEVYDINGKLLHTQQITDIVTSISSEKWPSGIYIWKVFSGNKEAECGKWVKE